MSRRKRKKSFGSQIKRLALLCALPLIGLGVAAGLVMTGHLSLDELPEGLPGRLIPVGILIAVLFVTASLLLPLCHWIATNLVIRLKWGAEVRANGRAMRVLFELLFWPLLFALNAIFSLLRFVLIVVSLVMIALAVVLIVRIVSPEFLTEHLDFGARIARLQEWVDARR